jgi:flagellar biogenesis protein FliO
VSGHFNISRHIAISGDNVVGNQNVVNVVSVSSTALLLAENPAELQAAIGKLRALIEQARMAGADEDYCDLADKKVTQLKAAAEEPWDEESKRKASGALALLKTTTHSFKDYAEIGENFEKVLKLVSPAIELLLRM